VKAHRIQRYPGTHLQIPGQESSALGIMVSGGSGAAGSSSRGTGSRGVADWLASVESSDPQQQPQTAKAAKTDEAGEDIELVDFAALKPAAVPDDEGTTKGKQSAQGKEVEKPSGSGSMPVFPSAPTTAVESRTTSHLPSVPSTPIGGSGTTSQLPSVPSTAIGGNSTMATESHLPEGAADSNDGGALFF